MYAIGYKCPWTSTIVYIKVFESTVVHILNRAEVVELFYFSCDFHLSGHLTVYYTNIHTNIGIAIEVIELPYSEAIMNIT